VRPEVGANMTIWKWMMSGRSEEEEVCRCKSHLIRSLSILKPASRHDRNFQRRERHVNLVEKTHS
jgi:hypothetical protein